ncbi:MAG: hotdog domain-containing protein [Actinomycetota bacterium]
MAPHPGANGSATFTVTDDDTAIALGSGSVPVLATPRVVAWAEAATVAAVEEHLEAGSTTVGTNVTLDHVAPTAVGGTVRAEAVLDAVDGRRLTFSVSVSDDHREVARGQVSRVVVDVDRFLASLDEPRPSSSGSSGA